MLGDAARRCRISLGLALLDAKSLGVPNVIVRWYLPLMAKHIAHVRFGYLRLVNAGASFGPGC
jgi:hypothetical protein